MQTAAVSSRERSPDIESECFAPTDLSKKHPGTNPSNSFLVDDVEATAAYTRQPWHSKYIARFAARSPKTYSRIDRFLKYWRGPRPKVNLPEPSPWLNFDWHTRHFHVKFPLETIVRRLTQPFTSIYLLFFLVPAYIIGIAFFSRAQSFFTPPDSYLTCTSTYWASNNNCGLNGELCGPYSNSSFDFRCPAGCSGLILQNPRTVGNEQIVFKPLIVGGGDSEHTYRGDSFICAAAVQAGVISDSRGGCASLDLIGNYTNFLGTTENGLTSLNFPTIFPLSLRFHNRTILAHCKDLRWHALALNVAITWILFSILRPAPLFLFWSLLCIGFWHITLFSQPRTNPPAISDGFGTFLPVLFIAYVLWRVAFRYTLPSFMKMPLESSVWYIGPFWVGILTNLTTDQLPISRLTASDLHKRSGAYAALAVILVILVIIVLNQIRVIRKTGWLPFYLGWYICGGLVILVIALLPGLQLRLHHYIIPLILLPGTAFPTRPSAVYQGYLLGTFLNGAAAFGLASILQTAQELRQDGPQGSALPKFLTNSTNFNASIAFINQTITWAGLDGTWDGFSLLVDDVERYVGTGLNFSLAAFDPSLPHFFRLAFTFEGDTGDFTMPATLWPNGTWVDPFPGPS